MAKGKFPFDLFKKKGKDDKDGKKADKKEPKKKGYAKGGGVELKGKTRGRMC